MTSPLQSIIQSGTKLWLDSIDPDLVQKNRALGATGATSNPIIVADLIKTGRFDGELAELMKQGLHDHDVAWQMTDRLVRQAQAVFEPVWRETNGDDGFVSFELDPLIEDPEQDLSTEEQSRRYVELGLEWSKGHDNRLIKIPATPGGIGALETLAARGVKLNVTLIFSPRQYIESRNAIWRGAQTLGDLSSFKSVYSIFVSRVDVYTAQNIPELSKQAQGVVGIVNAKKIWQFNRRFWGDRQTPLRQEIVFASTGVKNPNEQPWKYVDAFAGSDIQTNPPATNDETEASGIEFNSQIEVLPHYLTLIEIEEKMDWDKMEQTLLSEGIKKFADPQKALLALIADKRRQIGA